MTVYLLTHKIPLKDDAFEQKIIGFFATKQLVNETIEHFKSVKGFRDFPDCFIIDEFEVMGLKKPVISGQTVYFLQHEFSCEKNGLIYDYVTHIDLFCHYKDAYLTMCNLKKSPEYVHKNKGLYAQTGGFTIDKYILDQCEWAEGFI